MVQALVSAGANLEKEVEGQYDPLLLCCSCGSPQITCPVAAPIEQEDVEVPRGADCGHLKVKHLYYIGIDSVGRIPYCTTFYPIAHSVQVESILFTKPRQVL